MGRFAPVNRSFDLRMVGGTITQSDLVALKSAASRPIQRRRKVRGVLWSSKTIKEPN